MKRITILLLGVVLMCCAGCIEQRDDKTKEQTDGPIESMSTVDENTTEQTSKDVVKNVPLTEKNTEEKNPREDVLIAIDPGHQSERVDMSDKEPNAPGSSEMKVKATGGTTGRYTGVPEYQLNLDISLKLRDELVAKGYKVIMTRQDNDTAISNKERAVLANESGADISIRIHANGSEDSSMNGALAMVGSKDNPYVGHLYDESYRLADSVLSEYCNSTGMTNLGVTETDTMTGINWSQIPVMILEMGFMSNEADDRNMEDKDYQSKMVAGIVEGIEKYYGFEIGNSCTGDTSLEDEVLKAKIDEVLAKERDKGAVASAYVKNLNTGEYVNLSTATHRSASIIKLFIAGCVYNNINVLNTSESDIDTLVGEMISASDNDSANTLVRMLGSGDEERGMTMVSDYAHMLGCTETTMGRLMLDFDSEKENYTTVTDAASFLEKLYNGEISGSDKILCYMKAQERTSKIPSGLPNGVVCANKTGELEDVEHDVAIVYGDNVNYIICVMLSQLSDVSSGRESIKSISSIVYDYWK